MADYHAVLQRTLSGFANPKPELRTKLYARARTTIARQLENRKPTVSAEAQQSELEKLERAIAEIESSYDPAAFQAESAAPEPPVVQDIESAAPQVIETEAIPAKPDDTVASPPVEQQQQLDVPPASPEIAAGAVADPDYLENPDPYSDSGETVAEQPDAIRPEEVSVGVPAADPSQNDLAVDQWAKEFIAQPPVPEVAALEPVDAESLSSPGETVAAPVQRPVEEPAPQSAEIQPSLATSQQAESEASNPVDLPPVAAKAPATPPSAPLPPPPLDSSFGMDTEETLVIPPAQGFGEGGTKRRKGGGFLKWLLILLVLALLGGAGYYGWINKELVLEKLGMSDLLDDPTRPKPVKTITITPEPAQPEEKQPEPEAASAPKVESRLGAGGEDVQPTVPVAPVTQPVDQTPPPAAASESSPDAPPIAQRAILYEEGATAAGNSVDAGRVVWSVVQHNPANGEAKSPAIQARIDIPDRKVVLIMTIKRNTDKALPASHLIELVFAVPDDFPGGGVGQISRFVLKENEQGRGEGLIGVPARIADGIFLIALNNLDQAKQKNESLLKTRDWIDIPVQYSTGRRALMTIEKGLPGTKVFDEVFAAWENPT